MSRRPSSSLTRTASSVSAPYPRRIPGQPKSTRQQFSACGACRMRRVRCDLKDSYSSTTPNEQPSCSNCKERGIRCVDEFAEVKAVKLLRRGRRLQQVEAVYGKIAGDASAIPSTPQASMSAFPPVTTTDHSCIPQMQLSFLGSSFFRRFCVQRPVIEPGEFASRYNAHVEGTTQLNLEGRMLAMVLITWAASFGINQFGEEDTEDDSSMSENHANSHASLDGDNLSNRKRRTRLLRTEAMVREILSLVDQHGLLRRPSWDGVRVLLLLLPLTHGIQNPMERQTTYEATVSQVYSLCTHDNAPTVNSGLGQYCDVLIRSRVFWYTFIHEGITTGLNGGRLLLADDDLVTFQDSLPPQYCSSAAHGIAPIYDSSCSSSASSSPVTPNFPFNSPLEHSQPRAALAYLVTTQYFTLTLAVSHACRAIHRTLTGPFARRRIESGIVIRKEAITDIWDSLERCWEDFEALRRNHPGVGAARGDFIRGEDVESFVSGWQIFIFGCFNVIREALPHHTNSDNATLIEQALTATLHVSAVRRCQKFLPRVIEMLQRHLTVPSNFFAYDAGLIRDGCYFVGLLLTQSDVHDATRDTIGWDAEWEEGATACLQALSEVRWAYSCSHERERTLKSEWEARIERDRSRLVQHSPVSFPVKQSPGHSPCLNTETPLPYTAAAPDPKQRLSLVSAAGQVRPHLPPLSLSFPRDDSGPDTVLTDDGSCSWEAYTPPTSSGSVTGAIVAHRSLSPIVSPHQPTIGSIHGTMKTKASMFGGEDDIDHFPISVGTPDSQSSVGSVGSGRWTPFSGGDYLDPRVILTTSDVALGCEDGFSPLLTPNRRPYFA